MGWIKAISRELKNWLKNNRILSIIIAGSFLVCAIYAFHFKIEPAVDARAYDSIGWNLATGSGYRENLATDLAHDFAIARVGPLYEYFLAGVYKIFGHNYAPVWLIQAGLHALTAWLVYLTMMLVLSDGPRKKTAALLSAALLAIYPDLVEISAMLMTETLYLFLTCLMIYLFFRLRERSGKGLAAFLGFTAGLAVLARPPVVFLLPVLLFYFWREKLWRPVAWFLLVLVLVLTPWTARNYRVYNQFMPFGAAGNFNFWIGNQLGGNGEQEPSREQIEFTASHGVSEINSESMRHFKEFLIAHPAEFSRLTMLRINKYFSVIRPMGFWFYQKGLGQFLFILSSAAASVLLFVFGLAGILKVIFSRDRAWYYLLALAAFTPLIIFITVVETRYRFQLYPFLAMFAGLFIYAWPAGRAWWRPEKIFYLALALVAVNGLIDLFLSLDRLKQRLGLFL